MIAEEWVSSRKVYSYARIPQDGFSVAEGLRRQALEAVAETHVTSSYRPSAGLAPPTTAGGFFCLGQRGRYLRYNRYLRLDYSSYNRIYGRKPLCVSSARGRASGASLVPLGVGF